MERKLLKVASRSSQLARTQVDEALAVLKPILPGNMAFETNVLPSPGDRDQQTPLHDSSVPDDFFTRDQDDAILHGDADLAIHSAKDLPRQLRDGLCIAALLPAKDIRDALVLRSDLKLETGNLSNIGTSSPKRIEAIAGLFPGAEAKVLRGTVLQRLDALDAGTYDAIIVAACALERLGLSERISQYLPYDPAPQQGRLAIVIRDNDKELKHYLRLTDVRRTAGLVALLGCPADASLISRRAELYLEQADVIMHDRLVPDEVLLRYQDKLVSVGKVGGKPSIPQSEIHRMMLAEAESGKLVARLHGGDPGIYGHLDDELQFLGDWHIRTDVVPSLTAIQVAASRAHASLTARVGNKNFVFLSGHTARGDQVPDYPGPELGNVGMYMASQKLERVRDALLAKGWAKDTPVVSGERIGYQDERIQRTDLEHLPELEAQPPSVFLIGNTSHPPACTTLFVGTNPEHFLNHGPLIHWPLIRLIDRPLKERVAALKEQLPKVKGVIFPSKFAIPSFMEALLELGDVRDLHGKNILAVGPATGNELAKVGIRPDLTELSMAGSRALAARMDEDMKGTYLYPCSDASPVKERMATMQEHGIDLVPSIFYTNRAADYKNLPRVPFHRVIFTSSTTVKAYFDHYPEELNAERTWLAVGPSTLRSLEGLGLEGELLVL